ncbi:MAG: class I SAM-dependent methyltransferase [Ignavibacterium sp.]|jgi:ubiquinone/menaquinone biosynthesis C-methylase UbiE|nr:class I SAM-dependent methyltransferase [Ignavibacterium sp.]
MNFLKSIIKKIFSKKIINILANHFHIFKLKSTRKIFHQAQISPPFLEKNFLEQLQKKYSFPPIYGYDKKSLESRGMIRAKEILSFSGAKKSSSFLELGCWDGMVSGVLCDKGKKVTAIDKTSEGIDERAIKKGVQFYKMDASNLKFDDETFDFVFSYDSFEHFINPELVLNEANRVVKKGGYIFLSFGPLYYSAFGEHAYYSITVPYCQILFPKDLLNDFTVQNGSKTIDFNHVNGWSLDDYENLWKKNNNMLRILKYDKFYNLKHLNLITKYTSCFKSKSNNFDDFIVSTIEILFRKL